MTGLDYYKRAFNKWSDFNGRAHVAEYWYFVLFNIIVSFFLAILAGVLSKYFLIPFVLYALVASIEGLAVAFRRLHDTNRSGWSLLFGLIPLVGSIILIIFYVERGTEGVNRFGPNPLQAIDEDHFL